MNPTTLTEETAIPRAADSHPERPEQPPSVFKNAAFLSLWLGQAVSMIGNAVYNLALMWEMKVLTGSTVMMSTVSIAALLPFLVFGPFAGVFVDRWSKKAAMMISDGVRLTVIAVLTLLLIAQELHPWMMILGAALNSMATSVFSPANTALVPRLVGQEQLQQANSLGQSTMMLAELVGPFIGGFLVANVSVAAAFAVNAVSFAASIVGLLLIRYEEPEGVHRPLDTGQFMHEMKEGFMVIRDIELVRKLIPIALIANFLFAPMDLVFIQYCTTVLHGGAQVYGLFSSTLAVGMLLGALFAGIVAKWMRKGLVMTISFPLSALLFIPIALTRTTWLAFTLAALFGLFLMLLNTTLGTLIQSQVPQDKMGRVFGSFGVLLQGAQPVAQALSGTLLAIFSVPALMITMGVLQTINAGYASTIRVLRSQK